MIITPLQCVYGSTLSFDVTIIGSYDIETERGRITQPIFDVNQIIVRDNGRFPNKDVKVAGRVIFSTDDDSLALSGRSLLYADRDRTLQKIYNTTLTDRLLMRSRTKHGLPANYQLHWDRLVRGPMSPTLEQQVPRAQTTAQDGLTFTVTAPTAGNLLIIAHSMFFSNTGTEGSSSSGFNDRGFVCSTAFESTNNLLDKVASGSEGTSIVVTHDAGRSEHNAGCFLEYSGMTASPFIAGSFGSASTSSNTTTSQSSGTANSGAVNDALIIAAVAYTMSNSPTGFGWSNSFTPVSTAECTASTDQPGIRVASKVIAVAGSHSSTLSWTNDSFSGAGVAGAYAIATNAAPTITAQASKRMVKGVANVIPFTVADADDDALTVTIGCTHGTLTAPLAAGAGVTVDSGSETNALQLSGTVAQFTAMGSVSYTQSGYTNDTITWDVEDGTVSGTQDTTTATMWTAKVYGTTMAGVNATLATLGVTDDTAETFSITMVSEDATGNTDTDTATVTVSAAAVSEAPIGGGGGSGGHLSSYVQVG